MRCRKHKYLKIPNLINWVSRTETNFSTPYIHLSHQIFWTVPLPLVTNQILRFRYYWSLLTEVSSRIFVEKRPDLNFNTSAFTDENLMRQLISFWKPVIVNTNNIYTCHPSLVICIFLKAFFNLEWTICWHQFVQSCAQNTMYVHALYEKVTKHTQEK